MKTLNESKTGNCKICGKKALLDKGYGHKWVCEKCYYNEGYNSPPIITPPKDMISHESFKAYEKVRKSGVTNMFDLSMVGVLSGLQRELIKDIMKNYDYLATKYKVVA